jgi:surfactin synthase thioesterase subunit
MMNLFCIPFAGGNSYSYGELKRYVPESLNIIALDFPGHGKRMGEALLTNIHAMADDLYHQIKDHLNRPYAVWGHSLGGIVSYLLLKKSKPKAGTPHGIYSFPEVVAPQ